MKFKKRILSVLLVLAMMLSACGGGSGSGSKNSAIASAQGMNGEVKVKVTVVDNKITEVKVDGSKETEGIGSKAVEALPKQMVENNSINVDAITGATVTSNAIKTAAADAIKQMGLNPDDFKGNVAKTASSAKTDYTADIVVVGAGGAGMTAAITASDLGKKVVIVESQAMVGGNSIRSTGGLNATKTVYQDKNEFKEEAGLEKTLNNAKEKYASNADIQGLVSTVEKQYADYKASPVGYFDSPELMELDTMVGGNAKNDFSLVKALCENTKGAIDWLASKGIELTSVASFGGASVKRIHRPLNAEGKVVSVGTYIVPKLEQILKDKGIEVVLDTTADKLLVDNGKVVGVHATNKDGIEVTFNANKVILATGGFGANLSMVESYKPELKGFMTTNAPGILGQGIKMAEEIGAATVDMKEIQIHPTVEANTSALITEGLRADGAILVNANGERFTDEVSTRDKVSAAEIAQPGSFSWLIVDKKMLDASSVIQGYVTKGYTKEGNTYEELAKAIEVDPTALTNTMEKWNGYVADKKDPDFDRTSFAEPLDTAPYYAVKVSAGIHHTMGGLKIDTLTHVLDTNGNQIEGLFAAGEVTGGVHGSNRLGGNAVADFVVFGKIAGEEASK